MILKDFEVYVNEGCLIPEKGYRYKSQERLEMVELHVDEIPDSELLTNINLRYPFGGYLSVQKSLEEKPLLSFSHNECIFQQFIFTLSAWSGPRGEQAIIPKDEGNGIIMYAFQSREFGFGLKLSLAEIQQINQFRSEKRPLYAEAESAIKINSAAIKKPITDSAFILFFEYDYGSGKEGYWTYDHMCLQFEDYIDTI